MAKKKQIPMKDWTVEKPFDSADYLLGPGEKEPGYMSEEEGKRFRANQKKNKNKNQS